nr:hypothetical protein [uncultured Fretibacterium sp.]
MARPASRSGDARPQFIAAAAPAISPRIDRTMSTSVRVKAGRGRAPTRDASGRSVRERSGRS